MTIQHDTELENRITALEQQLRNSQRRNNRHVVIIVTVLLALVLQSWMQMVRINRLYDAVHTTDFVITRPRPASPACRFPAL